MPCSYVTRCRAPGTAAAALVGRRHPPPGRHPQPPPPPRLSCAAPRLLCPLPSFQLTKLDTLAGLAVRYKVTVGVDVAVDAHSMETRVSVSGRCRRCHPTHPPSLPCPTGLLLRALQVSDIKRANGLLADSSMFARDTLLIPTRPLPVGCAAVAAHVYLCPPAPCCSCRRCRRCCCHERQPVLLQ